MAADSVGLWSLDEELENGGFGVADDISDIDGSQMRPTRYVTPAEKKAPKPILATVRTDTPYKPRIAARIMESEAVRTPERFRTRVLNQFRSPENIAYLRMRFERDVPAGPMRKFAVDTVEDAIYNFERFYDLIGSDSTALRGHNRAGFDMWAEVRRINRAFYADRMKLLREHSGLLEPPKNVLDRDFAEYEDESYQMRMFISDSLRPPGLEHLNNPGPLYDIREDQVMFRAPDKTNPGAGPPPTFRKDAAALTAFKKAGAFGRDSVGLSTFNPAVSGKESFAGRPETKRASNKKEKFAGSSGFVFTPQSRLLVGSHVSNAVLPGQKDIIGLYEAAGESVTDDEAWGEGDPSRSPEQAMAEYLGFDRVPTTAVRQQERGGKTYGEVYAWSDRWEQNGGSRFMRYEKIPFWRLGGRQGYDYDIDETLGTEVRETGNPVFKVDLDRMRNPRGQEYRRYGARSSYMV